MSPAKSKAPSEADPSAGDSAEESLKRLGGGRWQTRDERFTIEPQSGTWSVVDAGETDDFGLPLVRGPFKSLTDAKTAIATARSNQPPESPLAGRRLEAKPSPMPSEPTPAARSERSTAATPAGDEAPARRKSPASASKPEQPEEPEEPGWFRDLSPAHRGRARRLIERLTADDVPDAAGIVRRDLVGDVPALAAHAIEARLAALGDDASREDVVELLAEGREERLGVRWRLVDGDGRPITIEARGARRRRTS